MRLLVLVFVAWGSVACSPSAPAPHVVTSDSSGVSIVVSSELAGQSRIEVDSVPTLRLGAVEGEELFGVAGAMRLADGTLIVLNGGSREVRWFDSNGVRFATAGRRGEGPGEFDRISGVARFRGDSLLVYDHWLRRATVYDAEGSLGRVLTLPRDMEARELIPLGDDRLLALTWSIDEFEDVEGPYRLRYSALLLSPVGMVQDTAFSLLGGGGYKVLRGEGDYTDVAPLIIEDGHMSARGGSVVYGSAERWEIRRTDADGVLSQIMRVPSLDRPFTSSEVEAERAAMLRPESTSDYRSIVARLEPPSQWPAFGDLLLAPDGWVWAAEYRSFRTELDHPQRWIVFDDSGAWVGVAVTPSRFRVLEVGSDYLLGVRLDDLDVEHVEMLSWTVR